MHYYIKAQTFLTKSGVKTGGYLEIKDGKFGRYLPPETDLFAATIIDKKDAIIAPGLVDTHIHGYAGHDVMDADPAGLAEISQGLLSCGVTSYLPTTLTAPPQKLAQVCQFLGEKAHEISGAKIQGIYLEGPYFTTEHKGAQNPAYMRDADLVELKSLQAYAKGMIKKIALAPERPGALEFTKQAVKSGVKVCLGHSNATYKEAMAAVDAGADIFVHTYNGMSGLNHRAPGMVGAAFASDAYTELICDGHHVHLGAISALLKAKKEKTVLVTDCMQAGGMPEGEYMLGEFLVEVKDGAARLKDGGSLAGSVLELFTAVKNLVDWGLCSLSEAFEMASELPAKSAGIADVCGSIQNGRDADFLVVSPTLELKETYVDGQSVYQR